ncbi:MAG TPA: 4a-hydroxytetrahydrobiopterin dehydratase [Spirochaetia bacterium]|nr:4a-hydroxytetrahydrobiopterin dehydratase [Spirochaetia bacterium]
MSDLHLRPRVTIDETSTPLSEREEYDFLPQIKRWSLDKKKIHHIRKLFHFKTFMDAIEFVNRVAAIAEELDHHPDIFISYQHVTVSIWTKSIHGLTENDFILAARIDTLAD